MLTRRAAQLGFNILEILTVVAVLGILIALAVPSFGEWLQNQQIRVAADALQNGYQVARGEAVRRNLAVQITVGPGSGWTVSEAVSTTLVQSRSHEEGTIAVNVVATPEDANTTTFSPIGGVVANIDGTPSLRQLDVDNPIGGACQTAGGPMRCLSVRVTGGGSIRLCDPKVTSPDPRAC